MQFLKSIIRFLLLSRIYIAYAAVGLCFETDILLGGIHLKSLWFYGYIFFATLFTYNLYYIKSDVFKYTKSFVAIGFVGLASCFAMSYYEINFIILGICVGLSFMYLLPILISFPQGKFYSLIKLFMLVSVWALVTLGLVIGKNVLNDFWITYNPFVLIYIIYRIVLITILCGIFFIKDETNKQVIIFGKGIILVALGIMFACGAILLNSDIYSFALLIISICTSWLYSYSQKKKQTELWHLFFVDGIMILQTIFVLIIFYPLIAKIFL